ncbi:MAG TPA: type II toxin-antitoxin system VapC family toxin [Azospirillum sp.]
MSASALIGTLFGALIADAASAKGIAIASALGATVAEAVQAIGRRRMEDAREILFDELRLGDKTLEDAAQVEEIVACLLRYGRAAQEGSARLNLRLMATVMDGLYSKSRLTANEFLYYADILSVLRREEIVIIGCMHRHDKAIRLMRENGDEQVCSAYERACEELVPKFFSSKDEFNAFCASASRTGLIAMGVVIDELGLYKLTPLMNRLVQYVDLEAAQQRETELEISP